MKSGRAIVLALTCISSAVITYSVMTGILLGTAGASGGLPLPYTIIGVQSRSGQAMRVDYEEVLACFGSEPVLFQLKPFSLPFLFVHDPMLWYASEDLVRDRYFLPEEFGPGSVAALTLKDPFIDSISPDSLVPVSGRLMSVVGSYDADHPFFRGRHSVYAVPLSSFGLLARDWNGTVWFSGGGPDSEENLTRLFRSRGYNITGVGRVSTQADVTADRTAGAAGITAASEAAMAVSLFCVWCFYAWFNRAELDVCSRHGATGAGFCSSLLAWHWPAVSAGSLSGSMLAIVAWRLTVDEPGSMGALILAGGVLAGVGLNAGAIFLGTLASWPRRGEAVR